VTMSRGRTRSDRAAPARTRTGASVISTEAGRCFAAQVLSEAWS
jgi:hypothetical protein